MRHAALPLGVVRATLMQRLCLNCTTESAGQSQVLFHSALMFAALISCDPFLDLALNKFLEIFGRPALGQNKPFQRLRRVSAQCWHARVEECRAARLVVISRTRA